MITKRIIPCLDVKDGRVVKGVNFLGLSDVSSPVELARYYSDHGADELVFYDITASAEGRALFTDILTEVASQIFIPLMVGGGINTLADFDRVLSLNLIEAADALRKKQEEEEAANADPEIDALVAARTEAKKAKNWAEADRIRDELKARGIEIIDTPQGAKWRKV